MFAPMYSQNSGVRTLDEVPGHFALPHPPTAQQEAMEEFRDRARRAAENGFIGAFPNFYYANYGLSHVGGTIFIKPEAAQWRDVPLWELNNVSLDNFEDRMRVTNAYAARNGFVGGFPNYFHADYGAGIVCGTILLYPAVAEWRDVFLSELGNPPLDDFAARFRATHDYALKNGFVGGFPNLFHAPRARWVWNGGNAIRVADIVCGTILLRPGFAEWRDVLLSALPR